MWIETTQEQLQSLWIAEIMSDHYDPPGVEFTQRGRAQVVDEVGEALVERYDHIRKR